MSIDAPEENTTFYAKIESAAKPAILDLCKQIVSEEADIKFYSMIDEDTDWRSDGLKILVCNASRQQLVHKMEGYRYIFDEEVISDFSEAKTGRNKFMRPIFYASVGIDNDEQVRVGQIETDPELRRNGIASTFYDVFEKVSRECGFRFAVGYHSYQEVAEQFLRRGRYLTHEIQPEILSRLRLKDGDDKESYNTVRFLRQEDEQNSVIRERVRGTPSERIECLRYHEAFKEWVEYLQFIANFLEKNPEQDGVVKEVIATIDSLNENIPEKCRFDTSNVDNTTVVPMLRSVIQYLVVSVNDLYGSLTAEYLDNDVEILREIRESLGE